MSWILYTLIAVILFAVMNILDKFIVSKKLKDPMLTAIITTIFSSVFFIILAVCSNALSAPVEVIILVGVLGALYPLQNYIYYYILEKEDVSWYIPLLATNPLFVALIAFAFLDEKFLPVNYLGIFLIVIGAILISLKNHWTRFKSLSILALAVLSVLFIAIENSAFKFSTNSADYLAVIFWFAVGSMFTSMILLMIFPPKSLRKQKQGIKFIFIEAMIYGVSNVLFFKAISLGPVTLISSILATKPLLVFLMVAALSFFHPKIMRESLSRKVLVQKVCAIILIVCGAIFIMQ